MAAARGDQGRAEVYAAELMAFEGTSYETVLRFATVDQLADAIMSDPWWPCARVHVREARSDASSSTTVAAGDGVSIRLAPPQMTRATVVHELAHVVAGVEAGHNSVFRRAHLDVAVIGLGVEPARWLADAYAAAGLPIGERTWNVPLRTDRQKGGPGSIAL